MSRQLWFDFAARSDRGPIRERNEDSAYADARVLALSDGVGGHPGGDLASALMIESFAQMDFALQGWDGVDHLRAATFRGEDAIAEHVRAHPEPDGMATTLTAVLLYRDLLVLLHAGDSRGYPLRGGKLYQLSKDDTFVQSLIDAGAISRAEARSHPQRNVVVRALTGRGTRFSIASWEARLGDRLLLCSDGLSDVLMDDEITEVMKSPGDSDRCAQNLVDHALNCGARDNVSCIVADVVELSAHHAPVFAGAAMSRARD